MARFMRAIHRLVTSRCFRYRMDRPDKPGDDEWEPPNPKGGCSGGNEGGEVSGGPAILYQFMAFVPTTRWPAHVSLAPASIVDAHFTQEEMATQFGGRLKYRHTVTGEDWIGVWGARKAS
jgi:hypothetical protein